MGRAPVTVAGSTVVATVTQDASWWSRPTMSFNDLSAPTGSTQTYRIRVKDPIGNSNTGVTTTGTGPSVAGTPNGNYATGVLGDDPIHCFCFAVGLQDAPPVNYTEH